MGPSARSGYLCTALDWKTKERDLQGKCSVKISLSRTRRLEKFYVCMYVGMYVCMYVFRCFHRVGIIARGSYNSWEQSTKMGVKNLLPHRVYMLNRPYSGEHLS